MSQTDSLDEETKRILALADSNDSVESSTPKDEKEKPHVEKKENKDEMKIEYTDDSINIDFGEEE